MQSRVGASYAANAGCLQPVVRSLRHYEAAAAELALRPALASEMRACLARNRWTCTAFDTRRWVETFDKGVHMLWEAHRHGLSPRHTLLPARHTSNLGG